MGRLTAQMARTKLNVVSAELYRCEILILNVKLLSKLIGFPEIETEIIMSSVELFITCTKK